MKPRTVLLINLLISLVCGAILAIPSLRLPRCAPGTACYNTLNELTRAIEKYNGIQSLTPKPGPLLKQFTESPANLAVLRSPDLIFDFDALKRQSGDDCTYGTVGDLSEDGLVVCSIHGTFRKDLSIRDRPAAFFNPGGGLHVIRGLPNRTEFYAELNLNMTKEGAKVFLGIGLAVFISLSLLSGLVFRVFTRA